MIENTEFKPIDILRQNISPLEVARYYLEIEFSKLFKNVPANLINETINGLKRSTSSNVPGC